MLHLHSTASSAESRFHSTLKCYVLGVKYYKMYKLEKLATEPNPTKVALGANRPLGV